MCVWHRLPENREKQPGILNLVHSIKLFKKYPMRTRLNEHFDTLCIWQQCFERLTKNLPHYERQPKRSTSNRKSLVSTKPVCQDLVVRIRAVIDHRNVLGIQLALMSRASLPSSVHRMSFHSHTIQWFCDPPHTHKRFSTVGRTHSTRCRCSWPISRGGVWSEGKYVLVCL